MSLTESEALVVERLRSMAPEMESMLEAFVGMDSHTDNHEGINKLGWKLEAELMKSGLKTSAFVTGVSGQYVLARTRADQGHRLMLLGHMDTVYPEGSVPLQLEEDAGDEDRLLGPGSCDMKGGLVVMLSAIRALQEEGALDGRDLTVVLSADEETGSPAGRDLIAKEAEDVHLCLVFEPGRPSVGGGSRFVTSRKGMARFHLDINGLAAHSGNAKDEGHSAAVEAAHKIIALEGLNDPESGIAVNVGLVSSGTAVNTVPGHARIDIDCRFTASVDHEELLDQIRRICVNPTTRNEKTGFECELMLHEGPCHLPLARSEAIGRMAHRIIDWGADLGLELEEESRGGASDGNITAAVGVPTVDGLGAVGGKMHAVGEWTSRKSLVDRSALLALTMMRFYEL